MNTDLLIKHTEQLMTAIACDLREALEQHGYHAHVDIKVDISKPKGLSTNGGLTLRDISDC